MMQYFAGEGRIATSPFDGGIEISPEQYSTALQGVLEGKRVSVEGGVFSVDFPPEPEPEPEPELTPEEILSAERAAMVCTPAQMRLALYRMDLLAMVQGIADSDPEASIVWEYASQIIRNSPLIEALGGPQGFTSEQIDDIFRAAMAVET